jgi:hypothetical protein
MPQSEIERHEAKIAELKIKLAEAKDADAIYYYTLCLLGWEKMLDKLKKVEGNHVHIDTSNQ